MGTARERNDDARKRGQLGSLADSKRKMVKEDSPPIGDYCDFDDAHNYVGDYDAAFDDNFFEARDPVPPAVISPLRGPGPDPTPSGPSATLTLFSPRRAAEFPETSHHDVEARRRDVMMPPGVNTGADAAAAAHVRMVAPRQTAAWDLGEFAALLPAIEGCV